jgi:hypothetical protein
LTFSAVVNKLHGEEVKEVSVQALTLNTFLAAGPDLETNQYNILRSLQAYHIEFVHNRLYPALSELIELVTLLQSLLDQRAGIQRRLPRKIRSLDLKNKRVVFEPLSFEPGDSERVFELIEWALPKILSLIEEGMRIHDFVEENVNVQEVGILPMYREEGYYFVPDLQARRLHLMRYHVSLFEAGEERYRSLKTRIVDSIEQPLVRQSPHSIKLRLIERYRDLPNPATFICETDIEFPFTPTVFPIAKRKLLARLSM